jgi:hypothetical protein
MSRSSPTAPVKPETRRIVNAGRSSVDVRNPDVQNPAAFAAEGVKTWRTFPGSPPALPSSSTSVYAERSAQGLA